MGSKIENFEKFRKKTVKMRKKEEIGKIEKWDKDGWQKAETLKF